MQTVSIEDSKQLLLGWQGEHLAQEIVFDFTTWQKQYGAGSIQLQAMRYGEDELYHVPLQVDGNLAVWVIERRDTKTAGTGQVQLLYVVEGIQVAKSRIFTTHVEKSLGQPDSLPPDNQSFGDKVAQDAARAEDAAKEAKQYEASAKASAQKAAESATSATQSELNAEESENAAKQSEINARRSEEHAAQCAAQSGYMSFDIDEDGNLIFMRTENVAVDFKLEEGELVVYG